MTMKIIEPDVLSTEEQQSPSRLKNATPLEPEELTSESENEWSGHEDDEDMQMKDAGTLTNDDTVIAVMGVTGAGKSTFISQLTKEAVEVGHQLESCTSEPGVYSYWHNGKVIRLIDTPGFDDTNRSDTSILKDIAFFLSTIYTNKVKLAGIIYLHRITDVRMTGSSYKNLQLLDKLCGDSALSKVVLATTMWNLLGRPGSDHTLKVGQDREVWLKEKFWGSMERRGSFITRHTGDAVSGQAIVSHLLSNDSSIVLDIQREMVDQHLSLDRTAAGMFLQSDYLKQRQKYERDLQEAQAALEEAIKEKDTRLAEEITKQRDEYQSALKRTDSNQSSLRVDLPSLIAEKDAQYASLAAQMDKEKQAREAETRFIEQNLTELRDALEKQERDHKEEMRRLLRSQSAKSAIEQARVVQLAEQYERRHAEMVAQIAAMEEEYQRKEENSFGKMFSSGFQSFLNFFVFGERESHREMRQRESRTRRRHHRNYSGGQQRIGYY